MPRQHHGVFDEDGSNDMREWPVIDVELDELEYKIGRVVNTSIFVSQLTNVKVKNAPTTVWIGNLIPANMNVGHQEKRLFSGQR